MVNLSITREEIESLYTGTCTIINKKPYFDDATKQTKFNEIVILENQPCRLSFRSFPAASQGEGASESSQEIKLFIAPEIEILAGSKISVTQNGKTNLYSRSSEPAVYSSHQEVILTKWERC